MIWGRACSLIATLRHSSYGAGSIRNFLTSTRLQLGNPNTVAIKKATAETPGAIKDVIIYRFESPRFFKYLSLFAVAQYGFWTFISYSSSQMVNIPVPAPAPQTENEEELPFWRKMNLGADKYKYGLTLGSAIMGCGILFISWMYILKSVRYLVLRKDGKTISFVTYTPFGKNRVLDYQLNDISAQGSRTSGASQLPVKVRGKYMYYLVDLKDGKFPNPQLFDRTVGTKRKLV